MPSFAPPSFNPRLGANWSQGASAAKQTSSASSSTDKKTTTINSNSQSRSNPQQQDDKQSSPKRSLFRARNFNESELLSTSYPKCLKTYVTSWIIEELIDSICEISTEDCVHLFVVSAIEKSCESLLKNIKEISEMLATLVIVRRIISYDQFHKGFVFLHFYLFLFI